MSAPRNAGLGFERRLAVRGFARIAGVDEVGRGCLAGPVVAAAVVLDPGRPIAGLKDSKLLTPAGRSRLARRIAERAAACGLGVVEAEEIDRINILRATQRAMARAVGALRVRPDFVLVDALTIPGLVMPQRGLVKGDRRSASIAAASIVAKVYRDGLMRSLHDRFPAYRFDVNKGYGTPGHLAAIARNGATPEHRRTFRGAGGPAQGALPLAGGG